jgi:hypothetical protein
MHAAVEKLTARAGTTFCRGDVAMQFSSLSIATDRVCMRASSALAAHVRRIAISDAAAALSHPIT